MTVAAESSKRVYLCDGATVTFAYPFKIWADGDLGVYLFTIADGTTTALRLDVDYTVTNAGEPTGGDVVLTLDVAGPSIFVVAPSSAYKLILIRELSFTQTLDLVASGAFLAEEVEKALDRVVYHIQRLDEKLNRTYMRDMTQTGEVITDPTSLGYILTRINLNDGYVSGNINMQGYKLINVVGIEDADLDTGIYVEYATDEDKVRFYTSSTKRGQFDANGLTLASGASVNEFSTDDTLAGNSDDAVPTEKAVKTYVDALDLTYRRVATKVVAANDSIDKTNADYICDGVADNVQIQAAIDALDTAGVGGRVILLEGTYNIAASITMAAGDEDLILQGQGWGTVLKAVTNLNDEVITCTADRVTLRDFYVESSTNAQATIEDCVEFSSADYFVIERVKISARMDAGDCPLHIKDCDWGKILDNHIILSTGGAGEDGILTIDGGSLYCIVKGNTIDATACSTDQTAAIANNALVSGMTKCLIVNNLIVGDGAELDYGVWLDNHADNSENVICGNIFENCATDAIVLNGANCSENLVDGNMARDGIADSGTNTVVGDNNTI